jgi:hypothetical protein
VRRHAENQDVIENTTSKAEILSLSKKDLTHIELLNALRIVDG